MQSIHIGKKYRVFVTKEPSIGDGIECTLPHKDYSCVYEGQLGKIVKIDGSKHTILLLCGHLWTAKPNQFKVVPISKYNEAIDTRYKLKIGGTNASV